MKESAECWRLDAYSRPGAAGQSEHRPRSLSTGSEQRLLLGLLSADAAPCRYSRKFRRHDPVAVQRSCAIAAMCRLLKNEVTLRLALRDIRRRRRRHSVNTAANRREQEQRHASWFGKPLPAPRYSRTYGRTDALVGPATREEPARWSAHGRSAPGRARCSFRSSSRQSCKRNTRDQPLRLVDPSRCRGLMAPSTSLERRPRRWLNQLNYPQIQDHPRSVLSCRSCAVLRPHPSSVPPAPRRVAGRLRCPRV